MDDLDLLEDLFAHKGWLSLAAEMEEALSVKLQTAVDSLQDERELYLMKGEVRQLRAFLSMPEQVKRELEIKDGIEDI